VARFPDERAATCRDAEIRRPDAVSRHTLPRERKVADLPTSGHSNDEIAWALCISGLRTVEALLLSLRIVNLRSARAASKAARAIATRMLTSAYSGRVKTVPAPFPVSAPWFEVLVP
jgi:DNA-binding CsgD family transcriptional regulator